MAFTIAQSHAFNVRPEWWQEANSPFLLPSFLPPSLWTSLPFFLLLFLYSPFSSFQLGSVFSFLPLSLPVLGQIFIVTHVSILGTKWDAEWFSNIHECQTVFLLWSLLVKNPPEMQETWSTHGWEDSPGEGKGYPLQYSGLENSMDCAVHGVEKSRTRLSDFHFTFL